MAIDRSEAKYLLLAEFIIKGNAENIKELIDTTIFRATKWNGVPDYLLRKKGTNPDMYSKVVALFNDENTTREWDEIIAVCKDDLKTFDDALDFLELFFPPPQVTKMANVLSCCKLLSEGITYKGITKLLGVSSNTISYASNQWYYCFEESEDLIESLTVAFVDEKHLNTVKKEIEYQRTETTIKKYQGRSEKVVIPNGIKKIGKNAFAGCNFITEIVIPDSVVEIGCGAFRRCSKLTKITIPTNVKVIGNRAFDYCANLTEIDIKSPVTQVGLFAFKDCPKINAAKLFFEDNIPLNCFDFFGVKKILDAVWNEQLAKSNPKKLKEMRLQLLEAQFDRMNETCVYKVPFSSYDNNIYKVWVPDYYITNLSIKLNHQAPYADMDTAKELFEENCTFDNEFDLIEFDYENFEKTRLENIYTCHDVGTLAKIVSIVAIFINSEVRLSGDIYDSKWNERGDYSVRFPVELSVINNLPEYIASQNSDYDEDNCCKMITNQMVVKRKVKN